MANPTKNSAAAGPLVGVKILDFCSFIAGAYGTMLMGDLGATVTKVESHAGDLARYWGPFYKGESRWFQGWNQNKRSISLDLRSDPGREIIYKLVEQADVLVENFRPGVTDRLKIDYGTVRKIQPKLIYCSSTAFGPRGPWRDRPAYDPVLQSMGGAAYGNLRYSGKKAICSVAASDYQAAMLAVSGVTAALYHRERTGEGQKIETSLLQGIMSIQSHMFCKALECEEEGAMGIFPYTLFETKDDMIFIGGATDKFWKSLCEAFDDPKLGADPRYDSNEKRTACTEELTEVITAHLRKKTTAEWEEILVAIGVPCAPVRSHFEFFEEPQVDAMGMKTVRRNSKFGPIQVAGVPIGFEKTPGNVQSAAPTLGEHGREVLEELGYSQEQVEQLHESGVIKL